MLLARTRSGAALPLRTVSKARPGRPCRHSALPPPPPPLADTMAEPDPDFPRFVGRETAGRNFPPKGFYNRAYDRLAPLLAVPTISKVTARACAGDGGHTELQVRAAANAPSHTEPRVRQQQG